MSSVHDSSNFAHPKHKRSQFEEWDYWQNTYAYDNFYVIMSDLFNIKVINFNNVKLLFENRDFLNSVIHKDLVK